MQTCREAERGQDWITLTPAPSPTPSLATCQELGLGLLIIVMVNMQNKIMQVRSAELLTQTNTVWLFLILLAEKKYETLRLEKGHVHIGCLDNMHLLIFFNHNHLLHFLHNFAHKSSTSTKTNQCLHPWTFCTWPQMTCTNCSFEKLWGSIFFHMYTLQRNLPQPNICVSFIDNEQLSPVY